MPLPLYKHGHARGRGAGRQRHPLYATWQNMRQRCRNPRHPRWPDYGGRGIFVCERWDDFTVFVADMGEPPEGASLDRMDNDGPYAPWNCRWATAAEQRANRRDNAAVRRQQYAAPWPFGVLTAEKHPDYGGVSGYLSEMLREIDAGSYEPSWQERDWLDRHYPQWKEPPGGAALSCAEGNSTAMLDDW